MYTDPTGHTYANIQIGDKKISNDVAGQVV